jgi:hypothetical protein
MGGMSSDAAGICLNRPEVKAATLEYPAIGLVHNLVGLLKGIIIGRLTDFLGENLKSVFDLPRYYDEIASGTKTRLKDDWVSVGWMRFGEKVINEQRIIYQTIFPRIIHFYFS